MRELNYPYDFEEPLTPEQFAAEMRKIVADWSYDGEECHLREDKLLLQQLWVLGYQEGVDAYKYGWYA